MSISIEDTKIRISELGLVAALDTMGFKPVDHELNDKQVIFIYDFSPDIIKHKENYFANKLLVDAYKFLTTYRALKRSLFYLQKNA